MIALMLLLASPAVATAPTPPVTASTEPAKLASAARLIDLLRVEATLDGMFVQLAPAFAQSVLGILATQDDTRGVIDTLITGAPGNRDRMVAILAQEFLTSIKTRYPALKETMAREYAAAFTTEELIEIAAFYSSGTGAKSLAILPQLQAKLSDAGRKLGEVAGAEAGSRAFEKIEREMMPPKTDPKS